MAHVKLRFAPAALSLALASAFYARAVTDSQVNPWRGASNLPQTPLASQTWLQPDAFLAFDLDQAALGNILKEAPKEAPGKAIATAANVALPLPDGRFLTFRFVEAPVMAPDLAAQFP